MSAIPLSDRAKEVIGILDDHPAGLSTAEMGVALGDLDYPEAYRRISEARWWLINTPEGQKSGVVIPRATAQTGFKFVVTNELKVIRTRQNGDYKYLRTMNVRRAAELKTAWNAMPSHSTSVARQLKVLWLQAEADAARYESLILGDGEAA